MPLLHRLGCHSYTLPGCCHGILFFPSPSPNPYSMNCATSPPATAAPPPCSFFPRDPELPGQDLQGGGSHTPPPPRTQIALESVSFKTGGCRRKKRKKKKEIERRRRGREESDRSSKDGGAETEGRMGRGQQWMEKKRDGGEHSLSPLVPFLPFSAAKHAAVKEIGHREIGERCPQGLRHHPPGGPQW